MKRFMLRRFAFHVTMFSVGLTLGALLFPRDGQLMHVARLAGFYAIGFVGGSVVVLLHWRWTERRRAARAEVRR